MENDEKDIFSKSKGQILFKIEKLSEFAQAPAETRLLSDLVFVRGLFWRIWVYNRENKGARHLSCYLYCNANNSGFYLFLIIIIKVFLRLIEFGQIYSIALFRFYSYFLRYWMVLCSHSKAEDSGPKGRQRGLCSPNHARLQRQRQ